MKRLLWTVLIVALVGVGCDKDHLKDLTLEYGTKLAQHQDRLMDAYVKNEPIDSAAQLDSLTKNAWYVAAVPTTPGNLVIRQWCLIDLLRGEASHSEHVARQMDLLSKGETGRTWAEGYSYWLYTKRFIIAWSDRFDLESPKRICDQIDRGFCLTAYERDGVWYPAPFADVRNEPLEIQEDCGNGDSGLVAMVQYIRTDSGVTYTVYGRPLGLNLHVEIDTVTRKVVAGFPQGFKFYEGYDKKYASPEQEFEDLTDERRIESIPEVMLNLLETE